jgi:hypothetical protein
MNLGPEELGYFISQVGLSAASFGVAENDVIAVGESLNKAFGYRCAPPAVIVPSQGAQLQSVCLAEECPLSPNNTCSAYDESVEPLVANATLAMGEGRTDDSANSTSRATGTAAASATASPDSAGTVIGISLTVLAAAGLALAL